MNPKTTYLIGAGASAKAIPVVAQLSVEVSNVFRYIFDKLPKQHEIKLFSDYKVTEGGKVISEAREIVNSAIDLEQIGTRIVRELEQSLSIDTIAKNAYAMDSHTEYSRVKAILSACFTLWERSKGLDPRYVNFWATLADVKRSSSSGYTFRGFKGDVSILSWNYDYQLEKSIDAFFSKSQWDLHTKVKGELFNRSNLGIRPTAYKLNGKAKLSAEVDLGLANSNNTTDARFAMGLASLILFPERFQSLSNLCFSWEERTCGARDIELAKKECATTSTLIVIGYSFPSLNTEIDSSIIHSMKSLNKVYFQGANLADSEKLRNYFISIFSERNGVSYIPVDTPGFFIPPEVTIAGPGGWGDAMLAIQAGKRVALW